MTSNPYQSPQEQAREPQRAWRGWKATCVGGFKAISLGLLGLAASFGLKAFFPVTPAAIDLGLILSLVTLYTGTLIAIVAGIGWLVTSVLRR
jgi:hypothetical protein